MCCRGLPLRAQPPGYNLALTASLQRDESGRSVGLSRSDGAVISVRASLGSASPLTDRLILVGLSWDPPEAESLQILRRLAW